ncbi:MAG TPA: Gfo/Idh/MocA family oxidoreductase [Ktedonobacterales bacterium]|jgi:predicted dehydrogenase|nr:Gfo/Idh/MocA family oxidoreductase [Ktedonobacterales bacterium]
MRIRVGVVGCGQWGQNYLRVLTELDDTELVAACDLREPARVRVAARYPGVRVVATADELLSDSALDAVVVATEARSHFPVVAAALRAGKHVLCEKPLTVQVSEAAELALLADACDRRLMVGHIFRYNAGVNALKAAIQAPDFGAICYLCLVRTNLGPIRADVNAAWDLAPHDVSIVLHLLQTMPTHVSARGFSYLKAHREDVAFITLELPAGIAAHLRVSWLDPRKVREVTVVGRQKMAVLDDVQTVEGLRIYDKGVLQEPSYASFGEFQHVVRTGEVRIPPVKGDEPLREQVRHFALAVIEGRRPLSDGWDGVRVVAIMDAIQRSLQADGARVTPELPASLPHEPLA